MKKKFLLIAAIIFLILSVGLFYVNRVLLPVHVKAIVTKGLTEQLKRQVTLDTLRWNPFKGFMIEGLTIFSKDEPQEASLRIPSASAQILFLPIFKRQIIIPSVKIASPWVRIVKKTDGVWDFNDLLPPTEEPGKTPKRPTAPELIISGLSIKNATIRVMDLTKETVFSEDIGPITLKGSRSLMAGFRISGDVTIPATQGNLKFTAHIDLRDNTFKGELNIARIDLTRYLRFVPASLPVTTYGATIKDAKLMLRSDKDGLTFTGNLVLPGLDITLPGDIHLKNDLTLEQFTLNSNAGVLTLQGNITSDKTWLGLDAQRTIEGTLQVTVASSTVKPNEISLAGTLTGRDIKARLNDEQNASAQIKASNIQLSLKDDALKISGDLQANNLTAQFSKDQSLSGNLKLSQTTFLREAGKISAQSNINADNLKVALTGTTIKGDLTAKAASISFFDETLNLKAQTKLHNGDIALAQNIHFTGDPQAEIHLISSPGQLTYNGTVSLADCKMNNVPAIDRIDNIHGQIFIETDKLSLREFSLSTLDTPIILSGEITTLAAPFLSITAAANDIDLSLIRKFASGIMNEQGLTLSGKADMTVHVEGDAAKLNANKVTATIQVKGAALDSSKLNRSAKNITGLIKYAPPSISWKKLTLELENKTWMLSGFLQDFENPSVEASLKTDDLAVEAKGQKEGETLRIETMNAKWFDSSLKASGTIELPSEKEPLMSVTGQGKIALADLPKMLPQQAKQIEDLKLAGTIKLDGTIKGQPADWQHWTARFSAQTPALYVMGYQIEDLTVNGVEKNGQLDPLDIKAKFYNGETGIISAVNIADKAFPFETTFKVNRTNLALLKRHTPLKDRQLAGFISLTGNLKGTASHWKTMAGKVTTQVSEGYLLEIPLLSNMLSILSSSFQGGDMTFTDANATLLVGEGKVSTNNLHLKSTSVTLLGEGWVDLDQNVDLNITPVIEPKLVKDTGILSALNPSAGVLNIRVTGTLQKPIIKHNLTAPTIIKKTLENTVGNLLKIFE